MLYCGEGKHTRGKGRGGEGIVRARAGCILFGGVNPPFERVYAHVPHVLSGASLTVSATITAYMVPYLPGCMQEDRCDD